MSWHAPAHARPAGWPPAERPVVVGLSAASSRRSRWRRWGSSRSSRAWPPGAPAHQGHLGPVAEVLTPESERPVWRRRRRPVLRRRSTARSGPALPGPQGDAGIRRRRAPPEILYMAHPHIGTFKLVKGGRGDAREDHRAGRRDPLPSSASPTCEPTPPAALRPKEPQQVRGLSGGPRIPRSARAPRACCARPQLARHLRHAARRRRLPGAKPFSIGVRIEHLQSVIDQSLWGRHAGHPLLLARPTTSWCTMPTTGARSTASACARAAPWSPRPGAKPRG